MKLGEVVTVGDEWYQIIRTVREDRQWDVDLLKQYWFCTHTFRKDGILYFCREVPKVEFEVVEDHSVH
jgi:hypothetical protein